MNQHLISAVPPCLNISKQLLGLNRDSSSLCIFPPAILVPTFDNIAKTFKSLSQGAYFLNKPSHLVEEITRRLILNGSNNVSAIIAIIATFICITALIALYPTIPHIHLSISINTIVQGFDGVFYTGVDNMGKALNTTVFGMEGNRKVERKLLVDVAE
jgi:hypothetical protein